MNGIIDSKINKQINETDRNDKNSRRKVMVIFISVMQKWNE